MMNIFWFRRDLRLEDNAGLYHALKSELPVQPIFIFDRNILDKLDNKQDPRVEFIHDQVTTIHKILKGLKSSLWVFYGKPEEVYRKLVKEHKIQAVYTNSDYESYALERDGVIQQLLNKNSIEFKSFKDHVIFDKDEVLKKDGLPYTVFTPYKRKWLEKLDSRMKEQSSYYLSSYPCMKYKDNFKMGSRELELSLEDMGFEKSPISIPPTEVPQKIIKTYDENRNYPSIDGTSKLGIHFRFGTLSIREKARKARKLNDTYLSELIWRDFYSQILSHFPHVENEPFRAKYKAIPWRNNEAEFKAWCEGKTGYPIVDAGMRELNETGHMHNRVRMIVASFLTKHLLIDWSWGEAYFAEKLLDFDLASNNGGWQWAAGCGTDAAPYFRIFNPTSQMDKFDKERKYIKKWVKEWGTETYPEPIVDHKMARERCLKTYKEALNPS